MTTSVPLPWIRPWIFCARRVLPDGCSYEFNEFEEQFEDKHRAWSMWQTYPVPADYPYSHAAADGQHWTYKDFVAWYDTHGDRMWLQAACDAGRERARLRVITLAATQPANEAATEHPLNTASVALDHLYCLLHSQDLLTLKDRETSRVPCRLWVMQDLARDALNAISAVHADREEDEICLDDWFPWREYIACHPQAFEIVGTGITRATATFLYGTSDAYRSDAQACMDFVVYRSDDTWCRFHPPRRTYLPGSTDQCISAKLAFSSNATEHGANANTAPHRSNAFPHSPLDEMPERVHPFSSEFGQPWITNRRKPETWPICYKKNPYTSVAAITYGEGAHAITCRCSTPACGRPQQYEPVLMSIRTRCCRTGFRTGCRLHCDWCNEADTRSASQQIDHGNSFQMSDGDCCSPADSDGEESVPNISVSGRHCETCQSHITGMWKNCCSYIKRQREEADQKVSSRRMSSPHPSSWYCYCIACS